MNAIISDCGRFRYRLEREIADAGIVIAYLGINPSTATAEIEDQTTMKWRGFALRNGARRYIAGNPFAYRATNVKELATAIDPIGPENDAHLLQIMKDADLIIPCWGNRLKLPLSLRHRLNQVSVMLSLSRKPLKCFGTTASGDPKHPLMLGYATQLVEWRP